MRSVLVRLTELEPFCLGFVSEIKSFVVSLLAWAFGSEFTEGIQSLNVICAVLLVHSLSKKISQASLLDPLRFKSSNDYDMASNLNILN